MVKHILCVMLLGQDWVVKMKKKVKIRYKSSGAIVKVSQSYSKVLLQRGLCELVNDRMMIKGRSTFY